MRHLRLKRRGGLSYLDGFKSLTMNIKAAVQNMNRIEQKETIMAEGAIQSMDHIDLKRTMLVESIIRSMNQIDLKKMMNVTFRRIITNLPEVL